MAALYRLILSKRNRGNAISTSHSDLRSTDGINILPDCTKDITFRALISAFSLDAFDALLACRNGLTQMSRHSFPSFIEASGALSSR